MRHPVLPETHPRDRTRAERAEAVVRIRERDAGDPSLEHACEAEDDAAAGRHDRRTAEAVAESDVGAGRDRVREGDRVHRAVLAIGVHRDPGSERMRRLPARVEREAARGLDRGALTEVDRMTGEDHAQPRRDDAFRVDGGAAAVVDEEDGEADLARRPRELAKRLPEALVLVEGRHENGDVHGGRRYTLSALAPTAPRCQAVRLAAIVRVHSGTEQRFVDAGEGATVSLLDSGYLLGDGVFATMRGYDGRCFRAGAHLGELARGADRLGIGLPIALTALADEAHRAASEIAGPAYVRVTLSRGATRGGPTLSIIARPLEVPTDAELTGGVVAVTVGLRRIPAACLDPTTKTTSYVAAVLARRDAEGRGAKEGLQLALDGSVAGGAMSSVFAVRGDLLLTPSPESGCRLGVTRAAVLELARGVGLEPREERLDPEEMFTADEVFFANTRFECLPVAVLDGRRLATAFPRTRAIRERLAALAREEAR